MYYKCQPIRLKIWALNLSISENFLDFFLAIFLAIKRKNQGLIYSKNFKIFWAYDNFFISFLLTRSFVNFFKFFEYIFLLNQFFFFFVLKLLFSWFLLITILIFFYFFLRYILNIKMVYTQLDD